MNSTRVAVVAGARTPFTKAGSVQKRVPPYELGRVALREAMERGGVRPGEIEEVIFGNIAEPPESTNIARVIALRAGCPESVPAYTVNRNCGSALQAVSDGMLRIQSGVADLVAVGGAESMSGIPLFFPESMKGKMEAVMRAKTIPAKVAAAAAFRPADFKPVVGLLIGLRDNYCGLNMGETAEILAREFSISRKEQDEFALTSHLRAADAQKKGRLAMEITPVPLPPRYDVLATEDVGVRAQQTAEALARLKPVFDRRYGTVTAGNSSQITDGAGALILASKKTVEEKRLPVLGWLRAAAFAGLDPARMGLGPVHATARLFKKTGVSLRDVGLIEMNEAFAAQVIANQRAYASKNFAGKQHGLFEAVGEIDSERLNVNGGAIALGHPVGATGARLIQTILVEMRRRNVELGLVTLCIGGGQGSAVLVEQG